MTKIDARERQGNDAARPTYYSPETLPLMQSLLATLANIEFEFERECEKVRGTTDVHLKARVLAQLKVRHQDRREPYIRELARLQKQAFAGACQEEAAA